MQKFRLTAQFLFTIAAALFWMGCGGSPNLPDTVEAGGIVTYKGDPLTGALVIFRVENGRPANAITGPDGRFKLSTFGEFDGAIPGEHTVTITKTLKASGGEGGADPSQGDTMEAAAAASQSANGPAAPAEQSLIPKRYGNPDTSQLKFTVSQDGENNFEIQLSD